MGLIASVNLRQSLPYNPEERRISSLLKRGGVEVTPELVRIAELPRYRWQDDPELAGLLDHLNTWLGEPPVEHCKRRCGHTARDKDCDECSRAAAQCVCGGEGSMSLRPLQAAALQAIHDVGGMLGPIRVGGGKTLISLLAGVVCDAERVLLIIPAKLRDKTRRDFARAKRHWKTPKRIHIMSYELLARDRGVKELAAYKPDMVISDEGHKLKNVSAACTKRIRRYFKEYPDTAYVDMSGTTTKRSIMEYYHRLKWALPKDASPLPSLWEECREWADAIDEKTSSAGRLMPGGLLQFANLEEMKELAADPKKSTAIRITRQAYKRRLMETPGIVGTEEMHDSSMSLIIKGHEFSPNQAVIDAFQGLRDNWEMPDGQVIDMPPTLWRHARELIQGFFYKWDPAPPEAWKLARREWGRAVREALHRYRYLDSPLSVQRAIAAGELEWARPTYERWLEIKPTFIPNTVAEWLDDSCLKWAESWAQSNDGIIWVNEKAFAKKLAERTGLPYYGAQGKCGKRMIEDASGTCIASIQANSEGRNLQQYHRNLIVSVPPGGQVWEQLLGRSHRDGQMADEVYADVNLSCYEQWDVFRQALRDAEYIERTIGQCQKLNFASIEMQDDDVLENRHQQGDPLWSKDNARFFNPGEDHYSPNEIRMASLTRYERADLRRGQG